MWKDILKGRGFTAIHYKHLRQACEDAFNKYGDNFLNYPHRYKDEIVNQATITYSKEMGLQNSQGMKIKFKTKFPIKIRRIVNIMKDRLEKAPRIPRKKGQPAKSKKHSDLYTDENPKGTIHGLGFKDKKTAKRSVAKIKRSNRSHNHKTQAAVAMEQRADEMGKKEEANIYRDFIEEQKEKTKERNK